MDDDSIKHDDDSTIHETGDGKAHKDDHTPNSSVAFKDGGWLSGRFNLKREKEYHDDWRKRNSND